MQRFISEDPIEFAGGLNLYAYVANNPISFRDPFGRDKGIIDALRDFVNSVKDFILNTVLPGAAAEPLAPMMGAVAPKIPTLPPFRNGDKTRGLLRTVKFDLVSGVEGPAKSVPFAQQGRGWDMLTRTHVEGHAAAYMNQHGITEATVYINNPSICTNCATNLPRMLNPGSQLNVVLPDGTSIPFVGGLP